MPTTCPQAPPTRGPRGASWAAACAMAALCLAPAAQAAPEKNVSPDPGRSAPVHRIPLFDADNAQIGPGAKEPKPLSLKVTCNKCHDYAKISLGWHFSAADPNVPPGRPGEPWVLTDTATGTQVPVAPRGWPGSYKPKDIALSSWQFVDKFGRQMPGGGLGERFADKYASPETDRWEATGYLPVNCLGCHHVDFRQNQDEWAKNLSRGNYIEAATAASGVAFVSGFVNRLPMFDRLLGEAPDNPQFVPSVEYNPTWFDPKGEVFLHVSRRPPMDRCYYCHSNHPVDKPEWEVPQDVHMAKGFACTDCHRNGLDHKVSRNYEGEPGVRKGYTCRGCHLGEPDGADEALRRGGHDAAPRPAHRGLPKLHLDKISCTACHSGPLPDARPRRVQTARIHALGDHGIPYDPNALPVVQEPVFVQQADGKIGPHRMVFPAFFGRRTQAGVVPLLPAAVVAATGQVLATPAGKKPQPPTPEKIAEALKALAGEAEAGQAVYVAGGKLHRLDAAGKLAASDHAAAAPYAWPIAHDVRPAAQSLGADGRCTDCHAADAAFLFGKVPAIGPVALGEPVELDMHALAGKDATYHRLFGLTFLFRPWLKAFGFFSSAVVLLILLAYGCPPVAAFLKRFSRSGES